ncbi:MAG: sulfotransferase, partial [Candidatus Hodarchaeota archaeon]
MGDGLKSVRITKPTYITGLARSGTTVVLEMLSQHPDIASHKYLHMVLPYAPHWVQEIADRTPIMTSPVERLHKDRLTVTRESPEAIEEIFWQRYFPDSLDELVSSELTSDTRHSEFERFYRSHLKKLLHYQNGNQYLAKNNYNVSRMVYLQKLFP